MNRVLCVDDNAALVEILSDMLRSMDYEPYAVTGGDECLEVLKRGDFKPDIILLDIMMSPMDGWTTLKHIRNDKESFSKPVLMLTGKFPTMTEVKNYGTLSDGYLMKPFAFESLAKEVENALDRVKNTEAIIQNARSKGADETMLNEYRRLSSAKCVLKQFEKIFMDAAITEAISLEVEKQLAPIVRQLNELGVSVS